MGVQAGQPLGKDCRMLAKPYFVGGLAVSLRCEILHGLVSTKVIHLSEVAYKQAVSAGV